MKLRLHHAKLLALRDASYDFCSALYHHPSEGRLLVLLGGSGNGKTMAAKAMFDWWNRGRQLGSGRAIFANWPEVVDGFKQGRWRVIEDFVSCFFLVLDDIGAEHDPSKIGVEKLYQILNRRENMFTVISTNNLPEEWEDRFERRVSSRMFRNSTHIDLSAVPDYNA